MKDVLTIILLLIALCCLIAMPQTLRNKKGDKYVITYLWKEKEKFSSIHHSCQHTGAEYC